MEAVCYLPRRNQGTTYMSSKLGSGYSSLTQHLIQFNELNKLPFPLERLDEGGGIEIAMVTIKLSIINHAGSSTIILNCKEQKREPKHQWIKKILRTLDASTEGYKAMRKIFKKMYAFFVVSHQALVVFIERLLSGWIIEYGAVQRYFRIQNC